MSKVVLLATPARSTNAIYNWLAKRLEVHVLLERPESRSKLLRRRVRRLGVRRVAGQLAFLAYDRLFLRPRSRRRIQEILDEARLDTRPPPAEAITRVQSANSQAAREALERLAPQVVVVHGTRIVSAATLASVDAPFLNIHAGLTPKYRGVHGGYWALVHGDPCGVTVHRVDQGVDTGAVLAQCIVKVGPKDNFRTLPWLQLVAALPDLQAVLQDPRGDSIEPVLPGSRVWTHPTLIEYLRHRTRVR